MDSITDNLQAVTARIDRAAAAAGRDRRTVSLLAVSKTMPAEAVRSAVAAGQRAFGENYVQEGIDKIAALRAEGGPTLEWHFIGALQGNKTRSVAEYFDWVHTIDRVKIAERLSAQRPATLSPLQVCLQVNISGEASKSGCTPDALAALAEAVAALPRLTLRGLMAIPEPSADYEGQCRPLRQMRNLFEQLRARHPGLDTLSMGMSHDLEAAVAEGSTLLRIGTAIFGERKAKP